MPTGFAFDTIDPAWVTNRSAPAGFASVSFAGDNRLLLTIGGTGSTASDPFYNTQGRERPGGISGL